MIADDMDLRLAISAPLMFLAITGSLLALVARPADLIGYVLVALVALPAAIGLWVFWRRPVVSRVLLALWAPAGEAALFLGMVVLVRAVGDGSEVLLAATVVMPLLALFALGFGRLKRQSGRVKGIGAFLWILALAVAAGAVPIADRIAGSGGMEALAGTVMLLFAPAVAFGAWGALALASKIPEPERPGQADASQGDPAAGSAGIVTTDGGAAREGASL